MKDDPIKKSMLIVVLNPNNPNNFRPHEAESMNENFRAIGVVGPDRHAQWEEDADNFDIVYWHLDAEKTPADMVSYSALVADKLVAKGKKQINHPRGWYAAHSKNIAYDRWATAGIPCPRFITFRNADEFWARFDQVGYPALFRINDGNTGEGTFLVKNKQEAICALANMPGVESYMLGKYGPGVDRKWVATEFIDHTKYGYRYSCRIIVAGATCVTGYARPGNATAWAANDDTYKAEQEEAFVQLNKECQSFCEEQEGLLAKALRALSVNYQGIDVIFRDDGSPVFLEIQPDFDCGNHLRGDTGPWWNPSDRTGAELVSFLTKHEHRLREELPMYWKWLDKRALFDNCHKALLEYFNEHSF